MRIDCIRTHHLRDELEEPFGFSQWYYGTRNALWVEIISDDGTTGWGECYASSVGPEAMKAVIADVFGRHSVHCRFGGDHGQQALAGRGAQGVHDANLANAVAAGCLDSRGRGAAEQFGKTHRQHRVAVRSQQRINACEFAR